MTVERCWRLRRSWSRFVLRGDIFRFRANDAGGHEQRGLRFGVVVQSNALSPLSTVIVAPTSQSALDTHFRPVINIENRRTKVLVEQMTAADARRLGDVAGHVTIEEEWAIDEAIALVVGLA
jgi:mRNA interferase MazF